VELLPEIASRRSIRSYLDEQVSDAAATRIVEAGRLAPSAKNRQAWRFVVVRAAETRNKLEDACFGQGYVAQAPMTIALCTTNVDYRMPNGQLSYPVDLGIAGAFMMIQAEHEGLGSCAVTTFQEEEVKAILSVPYLMRVVMLLTVGKPDEQDEEQAGRLSMDRLVGWEHW
jgi:nitroreductase